MRVARAFYNYLKVSVFCLGLFSSAAGIAADHAPDWMQALKSLPVPAHDAKADAVSMYSEIVLTVKANGRMTKHVRQAYKILRPDSPHAVAHVSFDERTKIADLYGWSIPAQGKDYAVKEKDAAITGVGQGFELITDSKIKALTLPAADPGALVGYEYELEEQPFFQEGRWVFQESIPVRTASFTLQLPAGWSYKAVWRNQEKIEPSSLGDNRWQWTVQDVAALKSEDDMPPFISMAKQLTVTLVPPAGQGRVLESWNQLGNWYSGLVADRRELTPPMKQKVAELVVSQTTLLNKMRALARFAQTDIRYVAIELGIGGYQPHFAKDIFSNHYGDCKDKTTVLSAMLKEIGIESYYVVIEASHNVVSSSALPSTALFNHVIIAIQLPKEIKDESLMAVIKHPTLGNLLIFDPTNEWTPLGQLPGYLQGNYALLVKPDGGELLPMPTQLSNTNGVTRTAKLVLNEKGGLSGDVSSRALGHVAFENRLAMQKISSDVERTKYIENSLANFLSSFRVVNFKVLNQSALEQPIEYRYSFEADKYAKLTGDMLIIRPRILGSKSSSLLEKVEKRENAVEFVSLQKDSDDFTVTVPVGYVADDLPAPVDIDYPFGSYHSKTAVTGNMLRYTRTFEIKTFTVPTDKLDDLKQFYRQIYQDERANAVFVRNTH